MVHLTLAIADFMVILITSALWAMGGIMAAIALSGVAVGGAFLALKKRRQARLR